MSYVTHTRVRVSGRTLIQVLCSYSFQRFCTILKGRREKYPYQGVILGLGTPCIMKGPSKHSSLKNAICFPSWLRTPPIPTPDASQSSSNILSKLGMASIGASVNTFFKFWKLLLASKFHSNFLFLRKSVRGAAIVLKFRINRRQK